MRNYLGIGIISHATEVIQDKRTVKSDSGTGTYSTIIAQAGYEVIGIDFVPAALDMARGGSGYQGKHSVSASRCMRLSISGSIRFSSNSGCLYSLKKKEKIIELALLVTTRRTVHTRSFQSTSLFWLASYSATSMEPWASGRIFRIRAPTSRLPWRDWKSSLSSWSNCAN